MTRKPAHLMVIGLLAAFTLLFAYSAFGIITGTVLGTGYLIGTVAWLRRIPWVDFRSIRAPYWLTLAAFALHKVEENRMHFQQVTSDLTGVQVPDPASFAVIMLLLIGVLPWLFIPWLYRKAPWFASYQAATLFASMGLTELAHFLVFPFMKDGPYAYYPGMLSVVLLAPLAWWGWFRLYREPPPKPRIFTSQLDIA